MVRAELTSTRNPRVKQLVSLRRRRTRDELGVTLIDGYDELVLALDAGVRPETVYYCPALAAAASDNLDARLAEMSSEQVAVSREVFAKVSYRENPDGWLAVVPSPAVALATLVLPPRPLVLVCEAVEKPGNLGAMLRTADAAGVAAVVAAGPVTDWGNPNLVRASKGAVFAVPVAAAEVDEVLDWLAAHDLALVAASPDAEATLGDVDLTGPTAIAVGAEHAGLSAALMAAATHTVRIPMHGKVNSLNVSTAAAITLYEAVRQRGGNTT
ncbi:MAG: RNA methyltransferase [Frankiales bacterium]|nr:RNA methyltransferase [Frankiales bacterium]